MENNKKWDKDYRDVTNKLRKMSSRILEREEENGDVVDFSYFLSELYDDSKSIIKYVGKIKRQDFNDFNIKNLDTALEILIDLRITIEHIKRCVVNLKKPLGKIKDETAQKLFILETKAGITDKEMKEDLDYSLRKLKKSLNREDKLMKKMGLEKELGKSQEVLKELVYELIKDIKGKQAVITEEGIEGELIRKIKRLKRLSAEEAKIAEEKKGVFVSIDVKKVFEEKRESIDDLVKILRFYR